MIDQASIGRVLRHVDFVSTHWADLAEARRPGTPRRWAQTSSRAESRRRATSEGAGLAGLTKARAPLHLDVLDTMEDVRAVSRELANAVSLLSGAVLLRKRGLSDPRPDLAFIAENLEVSAKVDGGWIVDAALDMTDDCSIVRARNRTATALRMILSGQVLDADCPWCGARPLRIEVHADEPLVVCRSRRVCEPPEPDCGTWVQDRPAWIEAEWAWMARRIDRAREKLSTG